MKKCNYKKIQKQIDKLVKVVEKNNCHIVGGVCVEQNEETTSCVKTSNEPEFDYPICFESKNDGKIVLFRGLVEGLVLKGTTHQNTGYQSDKWTPHTDTNVWKEIPYDKERGFYHKQPVYCWNNDDTYGIAMRFYDALNKKAFRLDGSRALDWDEYSAEFPEHMKEFKEVE